MRGKMHQLGPKEATRLCVVWEATATVAEPVGDSRGRLCTFNTIECMPGMHPVSCCMFAAHRAGVKGHVGPPFNGGDLAGAAQPVTLGQVLSACW